MSNVTDLLARFFSNASLAATRALASVAFAFAFFACESCSLIESAECKRSWFSCSRCWYTNTKFSMYLVNSFGLPR